MTPILPYVLHQGSAFRLLKDLPDDSVDSIVTDPPYGLGFMGAKWDATVPPARIWSQLFRVLKPGGYMLAFAGTRTQHRMASRIEDAGFEIRDVLCWLHGNGFPKSLNVSKQFELVNDLVRAAEWDGFGTALKPAFEPITMARKPLTGTTIENLIEWGVGALNVDACRVGGATGRWPANVAHDGSDCVTALFPVDAGAQSPVAGTEPSSQHANAYSYRVRVPGAFHDDTGSAARFFYCPKTDRIDRHEGLEIPEPMFKRGNTLRMVQNLREANPEGNHHPTVKPTPLMRWLVRMVTPPGGTVLDCFMGSGSTGKAAMLEGFNFIGMDLDAESVEIAHARIAFAWARQQALANCLPDPGIATPQSDLFSGVMT